MAARVYIGRLRRDVREKDVENFFKGYGRVVDISLKEGFGFINFEEQRDAEDAVYDLNGKELCGGRVIIEHAHAPGSNRRDTRGGDFRQRGGYGRDYGKDSYGRDSYGRDSYGRAQRSDNRVLVENLSSRVCWQDLKDLMKKVGDVTFADAHKLRTGEGVVEFASSSDVLKAIEKFDGYEFDGKKMKLKDGRKYSKRMSQSRSRSSSRSRNSYSNQKHRDHSDSGSSKDSKSRFENNSKDDTKEGAKDTDNPRNTRSRSRSFSDVKN
ncbi:hypothetical protein HELRODRAFT_75936 [Helobdella robusta]|uniref:RRM domain-containing protein n=1 Tax=Helobdella robusta TaxID=6412 RepID=T1G2C9_HELRO|nr:hypothetical protein HELRODRAFT_75936 [Helobdella robusta]ESO07534.1 hypothetical protein HELRODRAFT_75936 [Helobdella robusta]